MLKQTFFELIGRHSNDTTLGLKLWIEIEIKYNNKNRYYHNLTHLEKLLKQLLDIKNEIKDWDVILFSLYYHDIIYNVSKKNNEKLSARYAKEVLSNLSISIDKIKMCYTQILATSNHTVQKENDTNLFTDADLAILGSTHKAYAAYTKKVRKEYSIYPNFIYNPNRKKVLLHFLNMDKIFKTNYFYTNFEKKARKNIKEELAKL